MEQMNFGYIGAMHTTLDVVPPALIKTITDARHALRVCRDIGEKKRGFKVMNSTIVEACGLHPSHASDFFHPEPIRKTGEVRRSLPVEKIARMERFFGNTAISQWLAYQAGLTVLEEIQLARAA